MNNKNKQDQVKSLKEFKQALKPEDFRNYYCPIDDLNSTFENSKMMLAMSSGKTFCRYFYNDTKYFGVRKKVQKAYSMFELKGVDFLDQEHEKYMFSISFDYDIAKLSGYGYGRLILENRNKFYLLRYQDTTNHVELNIRVNKNFYPKESDDFKDNISYAFKVIVCKVVKDRIDTYINKINKKED